MPPHISAVYAGIECAVSLLNVSGNVVWESKFANALCPVAFNAVTIELRELGFFSIFRLKDVRLLFKRLTSLQSLSNCTEIVRAKTSGPNASTIFISLYLINYLP